MFFAVNYSTGARVATFDNEAAADLWFATNKNSALYLDGE